MLEWIKTWFNSHHVLVMIILVKKWLDVVEQFGMNCGYVWFAASKLVQRVKRWVKSQLWEFTFLFIYLLTYSMEQSPSWEANRFSATQEIPHTVWNSKDHYCIHKCLPPVPVLSQLDPVHTPTSHFQKFHLNIILPSMPGSPKWSLSLRFPHQSPYAPFLFPYVLHAPPISFFSILSPE